MPRHAVTTTGPAPFKRAGLHRVECPTCPGYAYATVAMLETIGFPSCACGERLEPSKLELALELGLEDHELVIDYRRRAAHKEMSQARAVGGRQKHLARLPGLADMDVRAYLEIRDEQAAAAHERRVSGLVRGTTAPTPINHRVALTRDTDAIPF